MLWCSSARRQHQIPNAPVRIGNTSLLPISSVRDLGIYLDADLTMIAHVNATVKACFAALPQIWTVQRSKDTLLRLLRALIDSKVDCYNSAVWDRLQSVLNAAARLLFSTRQSEHDSTSPPSLVESLGKNQVLSLCSATIVYMAPHRHTSLRPYN